jgi:NAD(P)-dependent dehydrogenase (short-subunit alcohol dehydrogenase family)
MHASVETGLADERVVVIGGSSAIANATVRAVVDHGGRAIVTKRPGEAQSLEVYEEQDRERADDEPSEGTGDRYRENIEEHELDSTDEEAVKAFFVDIDSFDHLVCATAYVPTGGVRETDTETLRDAFDVMFWGRYYTAKHGGEYLGEGDSITFVSGNAASRPSAQFFAVGVSNAAVETLAKYLAVEMSPVRVNTVSPGRVDVLDLETDTRQTLAETLPAKHIGEPEDIAETILFTATNPHLTGTVIRVDGGDLLV